MEFKCKCITYFKKNGAHLILSCTACISSVIDCFYSGLGTCFCIVPSSPASGAPHDNPTLPHPIRIFWFFWSSNPYFLRPPRLNSVQWWVNLLVVCLDPMVLAWHGINNLIVRLLIHLHSVCIVHIVLGVCIIIPNSRDCMCTWDSCQVPLSTATYILNQITPHDKAGMCSTWM